MPRLALVIAARSFVLAVPSNAAESERCADFRAKLAIERAALGALSAPQNDARASEPQVRAHGEAFFAGSRDRETAAGKVAAAITDKAARAVLDSAVEIEGKSSTPDGAIVNWKRANGRQWEGLDKGKPEPVFASIGKAQTGPCSAAVTAYHGTLKAACRIGQVAG